MFVRMNSRGPLYRRVYLDLRDRILSGAIPAGVRLPSTRTLAMELRVSRNVIVVAYEQLLADGIVAGVTGSGTYVLDAPQGTRSAVSSEPESPLPLSAFGTRLLESNIRHRRTKRRLRYDFRPSLPLFLEFPFETWGRILSAHWRNPQVTTLGYGSPEGTPALRQAIAHYVQTHRGVSCSPEQVIVVNGTQQALDLISRLFIDPGVSVVLEDPHYPRARQVFQAYGALINPVRVDEEGVIEADLPRDTNVRLAYVTPSHQFPTGVVMSLQRRRALLEWARAAGTFIIEDDYDSELRYEGRPEEALCSLDREGRVIYLGSFSKLLFPSLRIGYVVVPKPLVAPMRTAKLIADQHTVTALQEALATLLDDGHYERHIRRIRSKVAKQRAALVRSVHCAFGDSVEISGIAGGLHVVLWFPAMPAQLSDEIAAKCETAGVGLYSINVYAMTPQRCAGLVLRYASLPERDIVHGINRIADAVRACRDAQ